eukprot:ANDGO_03989.mRNA.1 cyclic nucleotide-binding protein
MEEKMSSLSVQDPQGLPTSPAQRKHLRSPSSSVPTFENLYYGGAQTRVDLDGETFQADFEARREELWDKVRKVSISKDSAIAPSFREVSHSVQHVAQFLSHVSPFQYMPDELLLSLVRDVKEEIYDAGALIYFDTLLDAPNKCSSPNELFSSLKRLCVVRSGVVLVLKQTPIDQLNASSDFLTALEPGSTFGETECLLSESFARFAAGTEKVVLYTIPSHVFISCLQNENAMLATISRNLRERQDIFGQALALRQVIKAAVLTGQVDLDVCVKTYRQIKPCIHRMIDYSKLDLSAWAYAINRLPENLTTNFVYFCTKKVNPHIAGLNQISKQIETKARRRICLQVRPGMSILIIRETSSDLLDFVCNLCIHIIESAKLRKMLSSSPFYLRLLNSNLPEHDILSQLPFDEETMVGLQQLFGVRLVEALGNIVSHHENYLVRVDVPRTSDYNLGTSERWSLSLKKTVQSAMECSLQDIDEVHLVSSNMHSIVNCLQPVARNHRDRLLRYGHEHAPDLCAPGLFENENDLLYILMSKYMHSDREFEAQKSAYEKSLGVWTMTNTDFTGIQVNIIPLRNVNLANVDSGIPIPAHVNRAQYTKSQRRSVIINIDYAFGAQATSIMGAMVRLFKNKVRSISVIGKAGGIEGERGDVSVGTSLIQYGSDETIQFPRQFVDVHTLRSLTGRKVFEGPILTVFGTLVQNDASLLYYKNLYRCVALEMESFYYARAVEEGRKGGLLDADVPISFLYYTSDVPMEKGSSLSRQMSPSEGVPPLYAITRCVLGKILQISHGF